MWHFGIKKNLWIESNEIEQNSIVEQRFIDSLFNFLPNAGRRDALHANQQNFVVQDMIDDVSSGDTRPNNLHALLNAWLLPGLVTCTNQNEIFWP